MDLRRPRLGWRGSARHWSNYENAYLILAAISTPLVLSVHSIVCFDFATSVIPGWHTTIFPPYFVAGAIFSGFAMVMTLLLIARWTLNLQNLITMKHLENMNKIILVTGSVVGYAYATEFFIAWYSGNIYERFTFLNRAFGPYWWAAWSMYTCNLLIPQLFWFKSMRNNLWVMFIVSIIINIGMWFERFVIIATSLTRDFLPTLLGLLPPHLCRHAHVRRNHRFVPHAVPALHPLPADDRHLGSERRTRRPEAHLQG